MNETNLPKLLMVLPLGGLAKPPHNRTLRYEAEPNRSPVRIVQEKGGEMNYPFEKNKKGHFILDTEDKLQWYMNRLLHREVNLHEVCASVVDLETVLLEPRPNEYAQQIAWIRCCASPSLREPSNYGRVDRAVVPVLREIHARRDEEMEQRSKEIGEKERELRNEIIETEKEVNKEIRSWYDRLFQTRKEQE